VRVVPPDKCPVVAYRTGHVSRAIIAGHGSP
jgi:hypothetical protein